MARRFLPLLLVLATCCGSSASGDAAAGPRPGPGWTLVEWNPRSNPDHLPPEPDERLTLFLVDPAGTRHQVGSYALTRSLIDWPDAGHATLGNLVDGTMVSYSSLDLATGRIGPAPTGTGHDWEEGILRRADGSELLRGTEGGLALATTAGGPGRALPVEGTNPEERCEPVRWWHHDVVLASCVPVDGEHQRRLFLVPVDGGPTTQLTRAGSVEPTEAYDYSDVVAWEAGGKVFVTFDPGCGSTLGQLQPDGTVTWVDIHGMADGSISVIGVFDDHLLATGQGCDGSGPALFRIDPATLDAEPVLGGSAAGGGEATSAVLFPEPIG